MTGLETLEREDELDRLAAALDSAAGGAGRLVVLEGAPGIGKTHLIEDVRALAKALGFGRLAAHADELERSLPWGVVRQLVERSVLRYSGDTRAAIIAGPAGRALEALDRVEESDGSEGAIARALHSLWWVAADLSADRPLLITVDDAQWADLPSLRFVAYLARRLGDLPIALVVATRPPEAAGGPLAEIGAGRTGQRLVPAPLSQAGVAALAAARSQTVAPEVVAALHGAAGGNPFLTGQLLDELERQDHSLAAPRTARAVRDLGPRTVSRALLGRLSPDALALASAAAVLGMRSSPSAAAALAALDETRAGAAGDELRRDHVLVPDRRELAFAHPVIREAVVAELTPTERARLHSVAARTLDDAGAPAERVALHLAAAPTATLPGAAHVLRAAAKTSLADGDAGAAAAYLERAVGWEPADTGLAADLGLALLRAGSPAEARSRLRVALRETGSARERADLVSASASATLALDGPQAAARELQAAIDSLGSDADRAALLVLEARLAVISSYRTEHEDRWGERLRRFVDLPGDTPEERAVLASVVRLAFGEAQPAPVVIEIAERALRGGELIERSDEDMLAWGSALHAVIFADGLDLARRELDRARTTLLPDGSPMDFAFVSAIDTLLAWRTGDVARCEETCAAMIDALALIDANPFADGLRAIAARFGALAALERGDVEAAAARIDELGPRPDPSQATVPVHRVLHARAALALARGDFALARREAELLGAAERAAGVDSPAVPWRTVAALAAYRLGDEEEARRLAADALALARRWEAASDIGAALRVSARVGPASEREAVLGEAIAVLEGAPWRLGLAGALCDLGEVLGVAGRRAEAREPLRRALELAAACGATALRDRARDALARLGDRPRELMFSGTDGLTASERRVADLAAAGRSNREIAQELFITPKTVENHLGRVYVKLGVRGRRELSGALA